MTDRPAARLYVETDLGAGRSLDLAPTQAHYLKNVLRLGPGDVIALFNGRDGEWRASIALFARSACAVTVETQSRTQTQACDLWLVFAPIKRARIDILVEKATEIGTSALLPVVTRHTMVERVNLERLAAHAIESAEQSERLSVPVIHAPQRLDALLAAWPHGRRLLFCDETHASPPIAAALAAEQPGAWAVLIGPEGGFAERELDALRNLPFVCPVGLGPRVLRSDTAALAALAVFQACLGDWRAVR
jgi:16S rRNA (uracil1498-N3)-methyltransferase